MHQAAFRELHVTRIGILFTTSPQAYSQVACYQKRCSPASILQWRKHEMAWRGRPSAFTSSWCMLGTLEEATQINRSRTTRADAGVLSRVLVFVIGGLTEPAN
jgi:hypothetical protein